MKRMRATAALRTRPAPAWWRSFGFAAAGLARAWRSERNLRVQAAAGWGVLGAGLLAGLPAARLGLLAVTVAAVLGMEMMNSAAEQLVDLVSPGRHPLAEAAKDLSAGAVLVVAAGAFATGLAAFWPVAGLPAALLAAVRAHPLPGGGWAAGLLVLVALAAGPLPGRRRP